jgi:DNA-directed RNA polymerase specialized sigma24 family protein
LLEAFHFERLRVARLAEVMGITERAVEGRLRRARERLRQELEPVLPTLEGGLP